MSGGLLSFGLLAVLACGPAATTAPPAPVRFARPLDAYRDLQLTTGTADFPAVASFATLAGPADSTLLLFGVSLPASALRFQREGSGAGFVAHYVVSLRAERNGQMAALLDRRETVRVADFAATGRTDESVVFQTALVLAPGVYAVTVRIRDGLSARGFAAVDTVAVPPYAADAEPLAPPVPVYEATPRRSRAVEPELILNPRHTAPYGGRAPRVYLEGYTTGPVRLELRDAEGAPVWAREVMLEAAGGVAGAVVVLPVDSLPMGPLWIQASTGAVGTRPVPLLVTLSDQWLVTNFAEAVELLSYIAPERELTAMQAAPPVERRRLWDAFWAARDPVPATPTNEALDEFMERVRVATVQFAEPGRPGWRTDRGEVYIVLGPPTRVTELRYDTAYPADPPRAREWVYQRGPGRLSLVFADPTGAGAYRLTPASRTEFRAEARRIEEANRP